MVSRTGIYCLMFLGSRNPKFMFSEECVAFKDPKEKFPVSPKLLINHLWVLWVLLLPLNGIYLHLIFTIIKSALIGIGPILIKFKLN